ncbi:MAG: TIR domain-containing protein, partial [Ktedonobacterales bacterium]
MVQAAPQRIFISYSRTDSSFVDRLDADLRARDFDTWVDRQRLEGGQDWMDIIQNAIDGCEVLVVVLSPDAVQSQPVKTEYRYAIQTGKPVLPLQYRACERIPIDLRSIQWVDFEQDYEAGLKGLLIGLTRGERPEPGAVSAQTPIQAAPEDETLVAAGPVAAGPAVEINLRQLYASGAAARSRGELERAAIYWQQILDKDPNYLNGLVASEMNEIGPQLHPIRVRRLREQGVAAHDSGNWGQEIGAWQALLALEPDDAQAKARL